MMNQFAANALSLTCWCVTLAIAARAILARRRLPLAARVAVWTALIPAALLLRGLFGEVYFVAPLLMGCLFGAPANRPPRVVALALALVGTLLIASALGLIQVDVYAWGYVRGGSACVLLVPLGAAWWLWPGLAWAWLGGLILLACGWTNTVNAWDMFVDLPSTLLCIVFVARSLRGRGDRHASGALSVSSLANV